MAASSKVSLKLLIDKKGQRVLFAEAGKDFVDFLFGLLVLPVSTIIRLLDKRADMIGGLAKLYYQSVSDLDDDYIQSNQKKDALLKLKSFLPFFTPQIPQLLTEAFRLPLQAPNATDFYKCVSECGLRSTYQQKCPICTKSMSTIDDRFVLKSVADAKGGGFVKGLVMYMVMDDLSVSPMSTIANITLLNIKDLGALEEKVVHVGMNEGLELLKHSLNSKTVLTDVFLRRQVVAKDDNNLKKGLKLISQVLLVDLFKISS